MIENSLRPPLILLTGDDDFIRRASSNRFLSSRGYRVIKACDSEDAINIFRHHPTDLVVTDLRMPKVDGMEILRTAMREQTCVPVITVSGLGSMEDIIDALGLGACNYLTKALHDQNLLEHAVQQALERANLTRCNKEYQQQLEEKVTQRTAELQQVQKLEAIGTLAGNPQNSVIDHPGGHERILFVDNEEMLRQMGGRMLQFLGYQVTSCCSGRDALEILQQDIDGFDLIITDRDNSKDLKAEAATRVLAPFSTTLDTDQGCGKGLSLALAILDIEHNGTICPKISLGGGTTTRITPLPWTKTMA